MRERRRRRSRESVNDRALCQCRVKNPWEVLHAAPHGACNALGSARFEARAMRSGEP